MQSLSSSFNYTFDPMNVEENRGIKRPAPLGNLENQPTLKMPKIEQPEQPDQFDEFFPAQPPELNNDVIRDIYISHLDEIYHSGNSINLKEIFTTPTAEELKQKANGLWNRVNQQTIPLIMGIERFPYIKKISRYSNITHPKFSALDQTGTIHASKVALPDGSCHIAAQVPPQTSFSFDMYGTFWEVISKVSRVIFDLTKVGGIDPYYPIDENEELESQGVKIVCLNNKEHNNDLLFSTYKITTSTGEEQRMKRIHFRTWPDGGVIEVSKLIDLVLIAKDLEVSSEDVHTTHCTAGVGRTGTFITALYIYNLLQKHPSLDPMNALEEAILAGRKSRDPQYVQTEEQFELLVKFSYQIKCNLLNDSSPESIK